MNATPSKSHLTPELLDRLHRVPVLSSLKEEDLECLREVELVKLADGDFIAVQGERAHYYWILLSGKARLYITQNDGRETTLVVYEEGYAFGELYLLANIPHAANTRCVGTCELLRFDEHQFWELMNTCPEVRSAILSNMAFRFQKYQTTIVQQEKMASLGVLAAGLMHELNNPGAAAGRAASQLRANLLRMHQLTAEFSRYHLSEQQKACLYTLQEDALKNLQNPKELALNSLEQSDREEALAEWMEKADVKDAWKLAPTLATIGLNAEELDCARAEFPGAIFSGALSWLEALVSSMQLVGTIEESIGRVSDLVKAVKSYAYEGKGQSQTLDVNQSLLATLMILNHKIREKQIVLEKDLAANLPALQSQFSGLNQIWTNLLDNAIDAVPQMGKIQVKTWPEQLNERTEICVAITDNGPGIPPDQQTHIFDPFFTTKPVGVGTGLGLGIVQRLIEQLGGTLHFSSMPGNTEFLIRLPLKGTPILVKH